MAAQQAPRCGQLLHAQARQALLHGGLRGQQAPQAVPAAFQVRQAFGQRHHAAALGPHRLALLDMRQQIELQAGIGLQGLQVQLRVAAGQP